MQKNKSLNSERDNQKRRKVLVIVEYIPKGKQNGFNSQSCMVNLLNTSVMTGLKTKTIDFVVCKNIVRNEINDSANSTSYTNFKKIMEERHPKVIVPKSLLELLPWVHLVINNTKKTLLGIFHEIKLRYLQSILKRIFINITDGILV